MLQRIIHFLLSFRRLAFCGSLVILGVICSGAFLIEFENSVESFLAEDSEARRAYREFQAEFGDDQLIVLVLKLDRTFTAENLRLIDSLVTEFESLEQVRKVRAITNTQDIVGSEAGFEVKDFISPLPDSDAQALPFKSQAIANPLYQIDLISLDGTIPSIVLEAEVSEDENRYRVLLDGVRSVLEKANIRKNDYYLAGDPIVELKMTSDMWSDLELFIPLTYLVLAIMLWFIYRDLQGVLAPLIVVSLGMGSLQGTIGYLGITMNAVTVGLPSLMLCVGILDCIHLMTAYRNERRSGRVHEEALALALEHTLIPCFQTSITTAIGFCSVAVSDLVPIREFGLLAAYCTILIYPICFLTMPYLLGVLPISENALVRKEGKFIVRCVNTALWLHQRAKYVLAALAVLICLSMHYLSQIEVETNHLRFIYPDQDIRIATSYVEKHLGGVAPFEIIIDTTEQGGVYEPELLKRIEGLQKSLSEHPLIDKSVSPVQFIKEMHQAMNGEDPSYYKLPDSRELIAQYILTYSFSGRDNDLDDYVDYEFRRARIRGRMKQVGSAALAEVMEHIRAETARFIPSGTVVNVTGHSVLQTEMLDVLVNGQVRGLLLGLFLMVTVISVLHRSVLIGVCTLIPNVIPLVLAGGLMGMSGISLNAGTAMTACIAFGLIVDDTIFFLFNARRVSSQAQDSSSLVKHTLYAVGQPVLFTSSLLILGFGILMFGHSIATVNFGLICGLSICLALLMDLIVLPIMLLKITPFRNALIEREVDRRGGTHV